MTCSTSSMPSLNAAATSAGYRISPNAARNGLRIFRSSVRPPATTCTSAEPRRSPRSLRVSASSPMWTAWRTGQTPLRSSRCIRQRAWSSLSSSWSAWKKDCSRTRARWTTPRNWKKSAASAMLALPAPRSVCTCCARSGVASVAAPSRAHHRAFSSTSRRNCSPRPRSPSAQVQAGSVRQSDAAIQEQIRRQRQTPGAAIAQVAPSP